MKYLDGLIEAELDLFLEKERFVLEIIARNAQSFLNQQVEIPCDHRFDTDCGCMEYRTRRELLYG